MVEELAAEQDGVCGRGCIVLKFVEETGFRGGGCRAGFRRREGIEDVGSQRQLRR